LMAFSLSSLHSPPSLSSIPPAPPIFLLLLPLLQVGAGAKRGGGLENKLIG